MYMYWQQATVLAAVTARGGLPPSEAYEKQNFSTAPHDSGSASGSDSGSDADSGSDSSLGPHPGLGYHNNSRFSRLQYCEHDLSQPHVVVAPPAEPKPDARAPHRTDQAPWDLSA